ncbi:hypothetical protein FA95DRAFT_1495657 [Auriscalpium vulgare]|uniref:Uncharacterized protein n=1 Tax=Auriscalpium vulgare TaxID=40419 RepID=A0ACB8RM59_9AGAM|nr:hypothetical protein FA95DRAFT_1495657 [Auriscalpium vulgare]
MLSFLKFYCNTSQPKQLRLWGVASLDAAKARGKGLYTAKRLRAWTRTFIVDRENLPFNLYGTWSTSMLQTGELAQDIFAHLQSLGPYIRAMDIVDFLDTPGIREQYSLTKTISLTTAQRWMHLMDYRWTKTPTGQYVDGHEREDVVEYRQETFLPTMEDT